MNGDVVACLVPEDGTLRDAMLALDRGAGASRWRSTTGGILVGIVTDGDVRRALLARRAA